MNLLKDCLSPEICSEYGPKSWKMVNQRTSEESLLPLGELGASQRQPEPQNHQEIAMNGSAVLPENAMEKRLLPNVQFGEFQSNNLEENVTEAQEEQGKAYQSEESWNLVPESESIPVSLSVAKEDKEDRALQNGGSRQEEEKEDSQSPERNVQVKQTATDSETILPDDPALK